jgi:hypothetical protein
MALPGQDSPQRVRAPGVPGPAELPLRDPRDPRRSNHAWEQGLPGMDRVRDQTLKSISHSVNRRALLCRTPGTGDTRF